MIARTQLVVLHFNEAIKAGHALTNDQMPKYKLQLSKMSKTFVVKQIKIPQAKRYRSELMSEVIRMIYIILLSLRFLICPFCTKKTENTDVIKKKILKIPFLTFSPTSERISCDGICYTSYYIFHHFTMLNFVQLYIIIVMLLLLYSFRSIFYRLIHDFLLLIPVIPKFYDFIYSLVCSIPIIEFIIQSVQTFISVILPDISVQYIAPCTQDVIALIST